MLKDEIKVVLITGAILLCLLFWVPVFSIWSLNILFNLNIVLNFKTWAAMLWILTVLFGIKFVASES